MLKTKQKNEQEMKTMSHEAVDTVERKTSSKNKLLRELYHKRRRISTKNEEKRKIK